MKDSLTDLNTHLFAQLERLSDEDLKGSQLTEEIQRARQVSNVASQIIQNGNLHYKVAKLAAEYDDTYRPDMVPMIKANRKKNTDLILIKSDNAASG